MGALALVDNARSLDLIKRTVAKDCRTQESSKMENTFGWRERHRKIIKGDK